MVDYRYVIGRDFDNIQQRMERMFNSIFDELRPTRFSIEKVWKPPVDIYETDSEVVVLVEIAGMSKKDISVTMEGEILKISGNRPDFSPSPKMRLHQMEIDYGKFERIIRISLPVEVSAITARYQEGFLKIILPKKNLSHQVTINTHREE